MPTLWWLRPVEQGGPGGGAQGGGVEPGEGQAAGGQALGRGRLARAAERARGPEPHVVEQDEQDVGCALGRAERLDGRKGGVGVLGVVGGDARRAGDREWAGWIVSW